MKLQLFSENRNLLQSLQNSGKFVVTPIKDSKQIHEPDVLLLDGELVQIEECQLLSAEIKVGVLVFYIMTAQMMRYDMQEIQEHTPNVVFLPPRLTVNQITEQVILTSHKDVYSADRNIHVFFGADSKVGTTITATACAEVIAEHSNARVGLILLGSNPVHYINAKQVNGGIDSIKIKLFNDILTEEDLIKACLQTKSDNLKVLFGPSNIPDLRYYHPEQAEILLTLASKCFDIVIVDAGCNVDRGLTLGAIRMAQRKYLVTTQQQNAKDRFSRTADQVFKMLQLDVKQFSCILNKKVEGSITSKQIESAYGMRVIAELSHMDLKGWQAEIDHNSLIHYETKYKEEISSLAQMICEGQNLPFHAGKPKTLLAKIGGWFK